MRMPPWLRDGHADQELQGCWYGHPKVGGKGEALRGYTMESASTHVGSGRAHSTQSVSTHHTHSALHINPCLDTA